MFRTFRNRLLFWFLVFISSSFVIVALSLTYLQKRETIFAKSEAIDQAYLIMLKSVQAQHDYFAYETRNANYFLTGQSEYLDDYKIWIDSTIQTLSAFEFGGGLNLEQSISEQLIAIKEIDTLFIALTKKINKRGFKDYNLEGEMRANAHYLEAVPEVPSATILTLRRHEKDYMIRNDLQYVVKFRRAIADLEFSISFANQISKARQDTIRKYVKAYEAKFQELVELDREIGIQDNAGLKLELDTKIRALESGFSQLVSDTRQWARNEFDQLTLYFGIMVIVLVIVSIVISAYIAHKITRPLRQLTNHITRFVDSKFTLEKDHPVVSSKDEIGSLTHNFSILKDEVISQMKFFKQRVNERTEELATANQRLEHIIEANSRFVPEEFLHNLGRESIEEVELGDQVEREMTVVFTDIRGFTQISENFNPQETFDFLNTYLGGIVPLIEKHGGFIDKFIGDSVMSLFPGSIDHAIKALMEFEEFRIEFNATLKKEHGMDPVQIGSGVHTGSMILGTIGHDNRLETTVISDAVNTAARVEGLTKFYDAPIIVTEASIAKLEHKEDFHYRFLDKVKVKGKSETLSVYEFLTPRQQLKRSYNKRYNHAIGLLREDEISMALEIFLDLQETNPEDKAVKRFVDRCQDFQKGISQGWGEVTYMTKK